MSAGCYFSPNAQTVGMGPTSNPKNVTLQVLSADIGPNSNSDPCYGLHNCPGAGSNGPAVRLQVTNSSNCSIELLPGTAADTTVAPSGSFDHTGWKDTTALELYLANLMIIPVYNGISGQNPRGFNLPVKIITGGSNGSGTITITVSVPNYGSATYTFTLVPSGSGDYLDTFTGPNTATGYNTHVPDNAPDGGAIIGYHGKAAYSDNIVSNQLVTGGNDGLIRYGRIYAGRYQNFLLYADVIRDPNSTRAPGLYGLLVRANAVSGNSDTGLDGFLFYFERFDDTNVWVDWETHLAGVTKDQSYHVLPKLSWPITTGKRIIVHVLTTPLKLYVSDYQSFNNIVLLDTAVPTVAPLNDSSHVYVGREVFTYTSDTIWIKSEQIQVSLVLSKLSSTFSRFAASQPASTDIVFCNANPLNFPVDTLAAAISYSPDGGGANWLSTSFDQVITNAKCTLSVLENEALADGIYQATVNITGASDIGASQNVAVKMLHSRPKSYSVVTGGSTSADLPLANTTVVGASSDQAWMVASVVANNGHIVLNSTGLSIGAHTANLTLTAADGSVFSIPITLNVTYALVTNLYIADSNSTPVPPATIDFVVDREATAQKEVLLTSNPAGATIGSKGYSVAYISGSGWLTGAYTGDNLFLTASGVGMAPGHYVANLYISSDASNSPIGPITVNLHVTIYQGESTPVTPTFNSESAPVTPTYTSETPPVGI